MLDLLFLSLLIYCSSREIQLYGQMLQERYLEKSQGKGLSQTPVSSEWRDRHSRQGKTEMEHSLDKETLPSSPSLSGRDVGRMRNSSLGIPNIPAYVEER